MMTYLCTGIIRRKILSLHPALPATGNITANVVPSPSRLSTLILPPLASTCVNRQERVVRARTLHDLPLHAGEKIPAVSLLHPGDNKGENAGGKGNGQAEGNGFAQDLPLSPLCAAQWGGKGDLEGARHAADTGADRKRGGEK